MGRRKLEDGRRKLEDGRQKTEVRGWEHEARELDAATELLKYCPIREEMFKVQGSSCKVIDQGQMTIDR